MRQYNFRCAAIVLGVTLAFMAGQAARAQQTSTGAFGSRTTGGTQGISAPRSGSTGSTSNQPTSANQMTLMQSVDGGVSGNERFMRDRRQGQFVGAGSEDARLTGVNQAVGAGGARSPQGMFGGGRNNVLGQLLQGQFNEQQPRGGGRGGQSQIRIPIRLAFASTPAPPAQFTAQFQTRLGRIPALTTVGPIQVSLEGDTVVLRGTVASEGDRQLAEGIALLEPAVSKVKNELVVQQVDTSGEGQPVPTTANP